MELTSDWEVGLSEITFPRSWYTIGKGVKGDGGWFVIGCKNCVPHKIPDSPQKRAIPGGSIHDDCSAIKRPDAIDRTLEHKQAIGVGYYDSVQDVCTAINIQIIKSHTHTHRDMLDNFDASTPRLRYNTVNKKVIFEMMKDHWLVFSPTLAMLLGLGDDQTTVTPKDEDQTTYKAARVADITKGINSLFVYCDVLQHVLVGDACAPLLRIVSASGASGEIVTKTFEEPLYVPLQKKNFDSIEIDIRDDLGRSVPFESGKVIVTLHFRRATTARHL